MPVTFRSGPRDPVTGQSSTVVSDPGNIVRASGQTDNERAAREASYVSYEPAAVQASEQNAINEANYQQFLRDTGRTATNPYGNDGLFTRAFGISPDKLNYSGITPGGISTLEKVNRLAFDQFNNPFDEKGNIRGMLREGSPVRGGKVVYDPTRETDVGIMSMIPYVGGLMRMANRRSALNVSPDDNPLFADMSDLGNELEAFPPPPNALEEIAPLESPAPAASSAAVQVSSPVSSLPGEEFLQGPPQLLMDEINTGDVNTIQGMLDFPGTQQARRFEASSSGTDRRGGEDLLRGYLERFPLYQ